ncbi:MAG: aromatic ring-hydroxylating dioxygenase subunit alpha [Variovorax sp.]
MKYVRNAWYVACWANAVKEGELFARTILESPIVFFRRSDGLPAALQDRCPHRFIPLHMGKIKGDVIECAYHGLQFDCSGACAHNPHGDGKVPAAMRVRAYPVEERHGFVWIWMGEEKADPSSIPDYGVLERPEEFKTTRGNIVINANYELMGENLVDLSHTPFLHEGLLATRGMTAASPEVREESGALHVDRWTPNVEVPQVFDMLFKQDGKNVDAWMNIAWYPPACFLLDVGVHAPGGQRESRGWIYGIHILTPETDRTTHYHFASASPRGAAELDEASNKRLGELRRIAFEDQDKPILDAQQQALAGSDFWSQKPVLFSIDVGAVRFRRKLEQMAAAEESRRVTTQRESAKV